MIAVLAILAAAQETADFLYRVKIDHEVSSVVVSPDGRTAAAAAQDGLIRFWNLADGSSSGQIDTDFSGGHRIAYMENGTRIAVATPDKKLLTYDAADGHLVASTTRMESGELRGAAFAPQTGSVAQIAEIGRVWLYRTGAETADIGWENKDGLPTSACFTPNGDTLWIGSVGVLRSFDVKADRWSIWIDDLGKGTLALAYSPTGLLFASADSNNEIALRRPDGEIVATMKGHLRNVTALAFSPDGRFLASADTGRTFHLWDIATGQHMLRFAAHDRRVNALAWTPDGRIVSGSADGTALVWDLDRAIGDWTSDERDLETLWGRMATAHPLGQHRAVRQMASTEGVAAFLGERVKPVSDERVRQLIRQLDAEEPDARDAAQNELLVADAEADLERALAETKSPEVRTRIEVLLAATAGPIVRSDAALRRLRAVHVLERVGTDEARAMLEAIGTREARAAAARTSKR